MRRLALLLTACAAACGDEAAGPWLTYPGAEGHARWFPLLGTAHDVTAPGTTVTCEGCHTDPNTFIGPQCTTACHAQGATDPDHAGVPGYAYTTADCRRCHPTGAAAGAPDDHDVRLFPGAFAGSAHHDVGVTCTQCHTDLARPDDPARFACGTCHLQRDAALVTKHTDPAEAALRVRSTEISIADSATCLRCHADAQVTTAHPRFGDGTPPHEDARCLECHDVRRSDKPFGIDFGSDPRLASKLAAQQGCYHCHDSAPPTDD